MPRKRTIRRENRRLDHKKARAAVRQVIDGGHVRQPQFTNWSSPSEPVPVIDDVMPHRSGHKDGCPKNHGGAHEVVVNPNRTFYQSPHGYGWWHGPEQVCAHCHKHFHGRNWFVRESATIEA